MSGSTQNWLNVFPDAGRAEEAMLAEADRAEFVDGSGCATLAQLLERLDGPGFLGRRPVTPLMCRLVLWACARELGPSPFGDFIQQPAFARAALALFSELKAGGLSPTAYAKAVEHLAPSRASRARWLSSLFSSYERRLAELGGCDREDLVRSAIVSLREKGLPSSLRRFDGIRVRHVHDFPPSRVELFTELALACEREGKLFDLEIPASGSAALDGAVESPLGALERKCQDASYVTASKADHLGEGRPLAVLGNLLFQSDAMAHAEVVPSAVDLFCVGTPAEECREIVHRVAAALRSGVPPEEIAIAYRDLGEESQELCEMLGSLDIPCWSRRGVPLCETSVGRLAFELLLLPEEGFPAHRVARMLGSRYAPSLAAGSQSPETWFRLAAVRDDRVGARDNRGAYDVRLSSLAERLKRSGQEAVARRVLALRHGCERLISLCQNIPARAPVKHLLGGWIESVKALGLFEAVGGGDVCNPDAPSNVSRAVLKAQSRDCAAVEALQNLVTEFSAALQQSQTASEPMDRRTFYRWLRDLAEDDMLSPGGSRSGVRILDLRELPGRSFQRVFLGGLTDGRFPSNSEGQLLWTDEDRLAVNRHLQREIFRLSAPTHEGPIPWGLAEDRLLFYLSLVSARRAVCLSFARNGANGQQQLASPFVTEVQRWVRKELNVLPSRTIPELECVWTESQLRERVALETRNVGEVSALEGFASEPWFSLAREQVRIEEERLRFFSNPTLAPGAFTGDVSRPELLPALSRIFAFGPDRPLSSSEANRFGNCAFQGFLSFALGLSEPEAPGEEQDPRGRGSFWHRVLELLFPALQKRGLLATPVEALPDAVLDEALQAAAESIEAQGHVGHPALWRVAQKRARAMVRRLLAAECRGLPFENHFPESVELAFGKSHAPEGWRTVALPLPSGPPVHLHGKIDRLDAGPGALGVVDYKTHVDGPGSLWERLLTREFQLPIYLYAARASGRAEELDGAWLNMKNGKPLRLKELLNRNGTTLDELLTTDVGVQQQAMKEGRKNLAVALSELVQGLRKGRFPIRPKDCGFCAYRSVCRISNRRLEVET